MAHGRLTAVGSGGTKTILDIITARSLTTNLVLCVDAADSSSTDGTSTTWTDRSATANFTRGSSSAPAFNGTAGNKSASEYFSFAGSDVIQSASGVTWMNNTYKNNATFTIIAGIYPISGTATNTVIAHSQGLSTNPGINFFINGSGSSYALSFVAYNAASICSVTSSVTATPGSWNFVAVDQNEASATGLNFQCNGSQQSGQNGTYSSPSTSSGAAMNIGVDAALLGGQPSGMRIAFVAAWSTNIGLTSINNLYNDIKVARAYGF